jgi:L-iditol 2-dehydrogenase
VRAAVLHAPGDLRIEDVPEPVPGDGEVLVRIEAATTCGTDVKTFRRGHPKLAPSYPARLGHEMAGVRIDTGERVLVSDSVPCGTCRPCAAGRPQICRAPRWIVGGFAQYLAAPVAALHAVPDGLDLAGAAMAEPLAAAVHAVARAPAAAIAPDAGVLGGGPMGQSLAALLLAEGRTVRLQDRHEERREQARALGADTGDLADHDVVFEAVGRPEAWRAAIDATTPGGCVVLVGGCAGGSDAALPTGPLHYDEVDVRGAFHHDRSEVERALELLAAGAVDWRSLAAGPIGLGELEGALGAGNDGPARKWVVVPTG